MSKRIKFHDSPVSRYAGNLREVAHRVDHLRNQLRNAMDPVQRGDIPDYAWIEADYLLADGALKIVHQALHAHAGDVSDYIDRRAYVEGLYIGLSPLLARLPELEREQAELEKERLFGPEFWVGAGPTAHDQWEYVGEYAPRGSWMYAVTHGSPATNAFLSSLGNFLSVVGLAFDVHTAFFDPKAQEWERMVSAANIPPAVAGLTAGGASVVYGGLGATAPIWVESLAFAGMFTGAIAGGFAIGVPVGLAVEGRYENLEAQNIGVYQHIWNHDNIVAMGPDAVLYSWHEGWKGVGALVYGRDDYKDDIISNDKLAVIIAAIKHNYPTAHVSPIEGAVRVVIPSVHGGSATMLTIDNKTGQVT